MNEVQGTGVSVQALVDSEYITIGCADSCAFNFINEIIGKTDVNAGLFRKKRIRISDFNGTVTGITTTSSTATRLSIFHFLEEAVRRSEIDMRFIFESVDGNVMNVSGSFLVETLGLSADINSFSDFDLVLTGTGDLSITEVAPPPDVVCEQIWSDWWEVTEGLSGISGPGHAGRVFAGHRVIEVDREGTEHDIIDSGTPGNRQAFYNLGSSITFDPTNPFLAGETIFVAWVEDDS